MGRGLSPLQKHIMEVACLRGYVTPANAVESLGHQCETLDDIRSVASRSLTGGITAPMLAKLLGLSRITIYKKASAGDIPCLRIGGTVRFDPVMIARWLDENEVAR